MTITLHKSPEISPTPWGASMPGWGIVADLTPPELRARRALGVLQKLIAGALLLVVALCVGGYVLAGRSATAAQAQLDSASTQTASIQAQIDQHSSVTQLQAATSGIDSQLSGLFASDVDVSRLVSDLAGAVPAGMDVTSINVSLTGSGTGATVPGDPADTPVGTVTLAGTSQNLNDLARYVAALTVLKGVTAVIPSTNTASNHTVSWTLSLGLTAQRYTHRFGGSASAQPASTTTAPAASTTAGSSTGGN